MKVEGGRKMMPKKNFSDFIVRNRIIVIALLILGLLFFGYEITRLKLNADFSTYLKQDDPLVKEFNRIGEIFAGKSIAITLIDSEDVFSNQTLTLVQKLTEAYENIPGVAFATSLTNVIDFKKTDWGLEVGKLIQNAEIPQSNDDLRKLRDYMMSKERYVGDLVSADGKAAIIVVRFSQAVDEAKVMKELRELTDEIALSTENVSFGGMPALMDSMMMIISKNMNVLLPIMLALIFLVLIVAFRRPAGIFLPLSIVGIAVVFTVGIMSLLGLSIDLLSGIMPVILVAMGSADGIHFMKRYYEIRRLGEKPRPAISRTFAELRSPLVITSITSMIGFASLVISDFSVITRFGIVTSLGIFLALVITFLLLPVVLSFSRKKVPKSQPKIIKKTNPLMEKIAEVIYKKKIAVLVSAAVIAVIASVGIFKIVKDVDWSLCLKRGSKAHRAEMLLREKFGGSLPIQVIVKGDIKDPVTLKSMRYLEQFLNTVPLVSESQSIASIISEMNDVMNDRYAVPETREEVANLLFFIEGEDMIEQLVTSEYNEALIQGKLATMETTHVVHAVDEIDEFVEDFPEELAVFDLREVPPHKKEAFLKIKQRSITANILWNLKARGYDVGGSKIEELVSNALFQEKPEEAVFIMLEDKIVDYLLSEESEIMLTSERKARAIARKLTERLKKDGSLSPEKISFIIRSEIDNAGDDDVEYLNESLMALVPEVANEIKVKNVLEELRLVLPPDSGGKRDLYRDLKGDLWEINENLMVMDLDEYREISGGSNPPRIQEAQVLMSHTGLAPVLNQMEESLIPSQTLTLILALLIVALILSLMLRSVIVGFISIIPISMTIMINFAVMGYGRIGLDAWTSMIASIAIGLGIDYAVHFNSRFKLELSVLKDELQALKRTLGTTGVAIIVNALTVGLGFSVLLLAGGQHIRRFGGLTSLTLFASAIFTLVVLPALILVVRPKFLKKAMA
jgi:predicted RND superfamily exporter protein